MHYLIIDTSMNPSYIAICKETKVLEEKSLSDRDQTAVLLPLLIELLENHHLSLKELSFIAVSTGPGTFTGTRVGLITAKSLSYASGIPLIAFSSELRGGSGLDSHSKPSSGLGAETSLDPFISFLLRKKSEGEFADPQKLDATYKNFLG